jgi:hypothetical protein
VPEENKADPPDHAKRENKNLTFNPEVNVTNEAEKL